LDYAAVLESASAAESDIALIPRLGGFGRLGGFPIDSLAGKETVRGSVTAYRRIASPVAFAWEFPLYAGAIAEAGSAWTGDRDQIEGDPLLWSTTFFAGAETPLGPLYLAYAYGEDGSHQGYLFLGQAF
jgi:NTE family protein